MIRRLFLTCVLIIGALAGFVEGGTVAYFTTPANSSGNQFTTGTVTLDASLPVSENFSTKATNLVPGDSFSVSLTIVNTGNLSLLYSMTASAPGSLGSELQLTVRTNSCASSGTTIFGPVGLSSGAFGSSALGAQTGDRSLGAGASESLCFTISLPSSSTLSGSSVAATFTFTAEQVSAP